MKTKSGLGVFFCVLAAGLLSKPARATPSTTFWTPATTDIQGYRVLHFGIDDYFTVVGTKENGAGQFPTDVQFELGVLPFEQVHAEIGVDLLEPQDDPFMFNAKIGTPEGTLFTGSPALNLGIFDVGTKRGATDFDIGDLIVGKTIPLLGRLFVGGYVGNAGTLVDGEGKADNTGFMLGIDHGFVTAKGASGDDYSRIVLAADYASGNNYIGGGGAGVYYYFTENISVLTGPVFFNDEDINGKWKWTTQLDINQPF